MAFAFTASRLIQSGTDLGLAGINTAINENCIDMKVYVIEKDAGSHYGVTMIDKIFLNKEDAEKYLLEKCNIEKNRLTDCFNKGNFAEDRYYHEAINNVNEGWITEYLVETNNL